MNIQGLQKMTLLDFPGKVACTVFLGGCDLRCPFCHNSDLIGGNAPTVLDDEGLLAFLKKRQGLLDGVAFTGGEPLLRSELKELIVKIRALGFAVKLDTNGTHPARLRELLDEKLVDYVAMDIKNSPARYGETVGVANIDLAPIRESVKLLMASGIPYEFRTTVVAEFHDDASFEEMGQWVAGAERFYLQRFTDCESVLTGGLHAPEKADMERFAAILRKTVRFVELRGVD
ncbi:MAG: anaerobic ribonucleoside-triphosphate reductase activating protein [Oscillospiraceae bacterium]|nr:anaerobic ribonucleoside-triphosphate reductase activating protein [Oscillospiraceae bacterium]